MGGNEIVNLVRSLTLVEKQLVAQGARYNNIGDVARNCSSGGVDATNTTDSWKLGSFGMTNISCNNRFGKCFTYLIDYDSKLFITFF